jgi:hypothetical protein
MSTPRDRDPFDDRPDDGSDWREPAHLGDAAESDPRPPADQPGDRPADQPPADQPAAERPGGAGWEPPGWNLPSAEPHRPGPVPGPPAGAPPARGGLFGGRARRGDPEMERAFTDQGDPFGVQAWALSHGWTVTDGTGPQDASLQELLMSAPVRPSKDDRPGTVLRGRAGGLDVVAFDIVYASGRYLVPRYAVTAVPLLGTVPGFRLSPARLWKHRIAGMVPIPSGDEAFDARWQLLATEDSPQLHRLAQDVTLQQLLLGTDDGDEFWSWPGSGAGGGGVGGRGGGGVGGHIAAVRPDGHRPLLVEHHTRLLTALVGALSVLP